MLRMHGRPSDLSAPCRLNQPVKLFATAKDLRFHASHCATMAATLYAPNGRIDLSSTGGASSDPEEPLDSRDGHARVDDAGASGSIEVAAIHTGSANTPVAPPSFPPLAAPAPGSQSRRHRQRRRGNGGPRNDG